LATTDLREFMQRVGADGTYDPKAPEISSALDERFLLTSAI
jgi:hypothetical protein